MAEQDDAAAKRLWLILGGVMKEYESRFGKLELDVREGGTPQPPQG